MLALTPARMLALVPVPTAVPGKGGRRIQPKQGSATVRVLVAGGAGYVGSHTCKAFGQAGAAPGHAAR